MKEWLKAESSEDVAKFYNPKYAKDGYGNFTANREPIIELLERYGGKIDAEKTLLDSGCGHGEFIFQLKAKPVCLGIDVSVEAVRLATERNLPNAMFLKMAIEEITSGLVEHFDYVVCLGALEHTGNIKGCFKVLLQTVKPGGVLLLQLPLDSEGILQHIENEPNQKTNERFASLEEWVELFRPISVPLHADFMGQDAILIYKKSEEEK